jgi:threonine dehydrogenase-like Zn-dependent dehydrogenase
VLAALTRAPGDIVVDDVPPPPAPGPGHVAVRPEVVGICGSDLHLYAGDTGALSGARDFYPRIQGHEVSAVIEDTGGQCPAGLRPGVRVAIWPLAHCGRCYPCRAGRPNVCASLRLVGVHRDGGLQQRLVIPATAAIPAPDLDSPSAAFAEPMSIAVHALRRAGPGPGEQAVVFGAGPIGLAVVIAATGAGARAMVIEPVQARRDLALRVGAERAEWGTPARLLAAAREWARGEGPPLIIDSTGATGVLAQAAEMACPAGRIVVVGMSAGAAPLRPGIFPEKEIDVLGSSCATAGDFRAAVRLVSAHRDRVAALLTHRFPLPRARDALEFALKPPAGAVKVLVTIGGDGA